MTRDKVLQNLCVKDVRNPNYSDHYAADDKPTPRVKCFCDNCFYGRDALALELLKYIEVQA